MAAKKKTEEASGYYELSKTLKVYPDAKYYFIYGERSNGKSYSVLEYVLTDFYNSNFQNAFAYIRRWKEDVTATLMNQVFKSLKCNDKKDNIISKITKGRFNDVIVKNKQFLLMHRTDDGEIDEVLDKPFGYIFSLSSSERVKSTGYPDVKTIFFDEFIAEGLPMVNEYSRFRSLLSTIIRNRDDVKIILAGNTINKHNVYFNEFGLKRTKTQKPGTIDVYKFHDDELKKDLIIVAEYADFPKRANIKKSNIYFAFDKAKNKMIRKGDWDIGEYPHLEYQYRPKDIKLMYFIKFEDEIYQCEVITVVDNKDSRIYNDTPGIMFSNRRICFTYIHKKTTDIRDPYDHIIFQKEYDSHPNIRQDIYNSYDDIGAFIKSFYTTGKVFYQDNDVGDCINAFLNN